MANPSTDDVIVQPEADITLSAKKEKIEACVLKLKSKGVNKSSAFAICTSAISGVRKASEVDELVKQFVDNNGSFNGLTKNGGIKKHTHTYTVLIINWGEILVGVTTSTKGTDAHNHTIKLRLDPKIKAIEAETAMEGIPKSITSSEGVKSIIVEDYHEHVFKANIDKIKAEISSIYIPTTYYYSEDGERVEGDIDKTFDEIELNDKAKKKKDKGYEGSESKFIFSDKDSNDEKLHCSINNIRQVEVQVLRAAQISETPKWFSGSVSDYQEKVLGRVFDEYSDFDMERFTDVEEMIINLAAKGKINSKAKVRNRGNVVFSAGSSKVSDNKDHFPINNKNQARNALARVAQFSTSPKWYKGTLVSLQSAVRKVVKAKYPGIKVTGLSDYLMLRFKEDVDVFFMPLMTENVETAKYDATLYFKACPSTRIDVVKFTSTVDGESKFTELGNIILFESKTSSFRATSPEIKLSERDSSGNTIIEILREGDFHHEIYGDLSINQVMMKQLVKNFNDKIVQREIAFDMNHMPNLPAAAWVRSLSITKRDINNMNRYVLNAHVKFTPMGEESVKNDEFKYFSAEYTDNHVDKETGKEFGVTLKGGGLTNRPWMTGLAPIQLSEISEKIGFVSLN